MRTTDNYVADLKGLIVKRYLVNKVPAEQIQKTYGVSAKEVIKWSKQFEDNIARMRLLENVPVTTLADIYDVDCDFIVRCVNRCKDSILKTEKENKYKISCETNSKEVHSKVDGGSGLFNNKQLKTAETGTLKTVRTTESKENEKREMIRLYDTGLTYAQIAEVLNCSFGSVNYNLRGYSCTLSEEQRQARHRNAVIKADATTHRIHKNPEIIFNAVRQYVSGDHDYVGVSKKFNISVSVLLRWVGAYKLFVNERDFVLRVDELVKAKYSLKAITEKLGCTNNKIRIARSATLMFGHKGERLKRVMNPVEPPLPVEALNKMSEKITEDEVMGRIACTRTELKEAMESDNNAELKDVTEQSNLAYDTRATSMTKLPVNERTYKHVEMAGHIKSCDNAESVDNLESNVNSPEVSAEDLTEQIVSLYEKGTTRKGIATELGCSKSKVNKVLSAYKDNISVEYKKHLKPSSIERRTNTRKRVSSDPRFKKNAVKRVLKGEDVQAVANDLNIHISTLRHWVTELREHFEAQREKLNATLEKVNNDSDFRQKVVKEYVVDGVAVSELTVKYGVSDASIYNWVKIYKDEVLKQTNSVSVTENSELSAYEKAVLTYKNSVNSRNMNSLVRH